MPQNIHRGYKVMVEEAAAAIETIAPQDAVVQFPRGNAGRDDVVLVDLRDPNGFSPVALATTPATVVCDL